MIPVPDKWTKRAKQGEELPLWAFTMLDEAGEEITTYDVKIIFRSHPKKPNALVLYPGEGIIKTGATWEVDQKVIDTMPAILYTVDVRMVLGNGKVYKMEDFQFEVYSSFNNG